MSPTSDRPAARGKAGQAQATCNIAAGLIQPLMACSDGPIRAHRLLDRGQTPAGDESSKRVRSKSFSVSGSMSELSLYGRSVVVCTVLAGDTKNPSVLVQAYFLTLF